LFRAAVVLAMVLLPSVVYLFTIHGSGEGFLYMMVMWPPVVIGIFLLFYMSAHSMLARPEGRYYANNASHSSPITSYKGRCPSCNGKVYEEDRSCRWCDWDVVEDRLRPPV